MIPGITICENCSAGQSAGGSLPFCSDLRDGLQPGAKRAPNPVRALLEWIGGMARSSSGQTLVEFALILVFATIVVVFALSSIGPDVAEPLNNVANSF